MSDSGDALITVVMAEYNTDPRHLRQSINSIIAQTWTNYEAIIVDDGTDTDVRTVVAEFADARFRVIGYGENRGLAAALNFGMEHAKGKYIARMDTDDIAEPTYLEKTIAFLESRPEFGVVSGQAREFSDAGPALVQGVPGEITPKSLMRGHAPIHPATVMRAQDARALGGYPLYRRAEDLALWCEMMLANVRMFILPEVLCNYRLNLEDYQKRKLRHRLDEIRVRFRYYPLLGAGLLEYLQIIKSIGSGLLPVRVVRWLRTKRATSALSTL